jgi:hypothetical protein
VSKVIVDASTVAKLVGLRESAEICDGSGRLLGHFIPAVDYSQEGGRPPISEEELKRRERQGGGRSLATILADLEKRA